MTPEDLASIILNELNLKYHESGKADVAYIDADGGLSEVIIDGRVDLLALSETIIQVMK